MSNIRISQENYDNLKSIMYGRSWDQLLADLARPYLQTNNNTPINQASAQESTIVPAPYTEHDRAIILPSGTVLVDNDRNIIDINGQYITFQDGLTARKMVKYLKEYTGHSFQYMINEWRGNEVTVQRWYTTYDDANGIQAIELAETELFLRSKGINPLATPTT